MNQKPVFYYHSIGSAALFILSGGVFSLPLKNGNNFTLLAFVVTAIICLLIYFFAIPFSDYLFTQKDSCSLFNRICSLSFLLIISVYSLFCMADIFKEFILFAKSLLLPEFPLFVSVILLLISTLIFLTRRQEDILKFSLLAFVFSSLLILFFFLLNINKYDINNILIYRLPTFNELKIQITPYINKVLLPSLLVPIYQTFTFEKCSKGSSFCGAFIGLLLLGICLFGSALLFGPELSGKLDYPYYSFVSTITVGRLFTRLDGFSLFLYFASSIIKINLCLYIAFKSLKKINILLTK